MTFLGSAVMPATDGWKYALFAYVPRRLYPRKGTTPSESSLVTVFTAPTLPERPVSPRIALNVAVSFFLGTFVGVAAAFVLEGLERVRERGTW